MAPRTCILLSLLSAASPLATAAAAEDGPGTDRDTVVVNGVPVEERILPTMTVSSSTYGLNLGVMDTPRSVSLISRAQLDSVNIQDPRSFSYLTSSSFTDAAFGGPNVPRLRGQYADVFLNGMRLSFTSTGYGAPVSFNSVETIDIIKGAPSVTAGTGPGVGGSVNFSTKRPSWKTFGGSALVDFDTINGRRWTGDFGGPIAGSSLAYRISYSGEMSDSYFRTQFKDQHAVYFVIASPDSNRYSFQFNAEAVYTHYKENVGINRVNQALISDDAYLTGLPIGTAVGGNPYALISNYLQPFDLTGTTRISRRTNIDETPGTSGRALTINGQLQQKLEIGNNLILRNNTFFNFENRDNRAMYYYADSSHGSYSIENKTELSLDFDTRLGGKASGLTLSSSVNAGFDFRYTHVDVIANFSNETLSLFDLSGDPASWIFPSTSQYTATAPDYPPAFLYKSAWGRSLYGIPGRDPVNGNYTNQSNLYDLALFLEHKIQITPQLSLLYGVRGDLLKAEEHDPLGGPIFNGLPQDHETAWYADLNANVSAIWRVRPWVSLYTTYNYGQNVSGQYGGGGISTIGASDKDAFRQESKLYEAGIKFDLMHRTLYAGAAIFQQDRILPTGAGGTVADRARLTGIEAEINYQPARHFYATASYSYLRIRLTQAASFYNFPSHPGINYDGAGNLAIFAPGQRFDGPGMPKHVFNALGHYRFDSGLGFRAGLQVTGPIETTTSGLLDLAAIAAAGNIGYIPQSIVAAGGYYKSPHIPWQYTMNAAIFRDFGRFHVDLAVNNLTNQRNWQPNAPYYGNDSILRQNPRNVQLTGKVRF